MLTFVCGTAEVFSVKYGTSKTGNAFVYVRLTASQWTENNPKPLYLRGALFADSGTGTLPKGLREGERVEYAGTIKQVEKGGLLLTLNTLKRGGR